MNTAKIYARGQFDGDNHENPNLWTVTLRPCEADGYPLLDLPNLQIFVGGSHFSTLHSISHGCMLDEEDGSVLFSICGNPAKHGGGVAWYTFEVVDRWTVEELAILFARQQ